MDKRYVEGCEPKPKQKDNPSGVVVTRKRTDPAVARERLKALKESLKGVNDEKA